MRMISFKGIIIIICLAICITYNSTKADIKEVEFHETDQKIEDDEYDIISEGSNYKQYEKAEVIIAHLKELGWTSKDEQVQDNNINRNGYNDFDEVEVFPDFLNIDELMDKSSTATPTDIKYKGDNTKSFKEKFFLADVSNKYEGKYFDTQTEEECLIDLIRAGYSPITNGINNYIYAVNLYKGIDVEKGTDQFLTRTDRFLTNSAYMYFEYLKLEVNSVGVKNSEDWCLAEFKNHSEYSKNSKYSILRIERIQYSEFLKCKRTTTESGMGMMFAIENYCQAYNHTKNDLKQMAPKRYSDKTMFPVKYYEYMQMEFSKYNILNSDGWCKKNKPSTKYFSDPTGVKECVNNLMIYTLNPTNDGLENYAIVWSKINTQFFKFIPDDVKNYIKYLTEIVESWTVVGGNQWCVENAHSTTELSECSDLLRDNKLYSDSGSENYFNSFIRFFIDVLDIPDNLTSNAIPNNLTSIDIPKNLKSYAKDYFAYLHRKSSELNILKTKPWCAGESGYRGLSCTERIYAHFKDVQFFRTAHFYVVHIMINMIPKYISDPLVLDFIDYLFESIKNQTGHIIMNPYTYCVNRTADSVGSNIDYPEREKCLQIMYKHGLFMNTVEANYKHIYYNLSFKIAKEGYIQQYINYLVVLMEHDGEKLFKGQDATSWCNLNIPSMLDRKYSSSQNLPENDTDSTKKSDKILEKESKPAPVEDLKLTEGIQVEDSKLTEGIPVEETADESSDESEEDSTLLEDITGKDLPSKKNDLINLNEDPNASRYQRIKNIRDSTKSFLETKLREPYRINLAFMTTPYQVAKNAFFRNNEVQEAEIYNDELV